MTEAASNLPSGLGLVGDWEELGRGVFSRSHKRRASNTGVPLEVFLEKGQVKDISVDRLTLAPVEVAVANSSKAGAQRDPPRNFYGWAVVSTERVRQAGCTVKDSPLCCNDYHADIVLPDGAIESADAQRQYATTLAGMSKWKDLPTST